MPASTFGRVKKERGKTLRKTNCLKALSAIAMRLKRNCRLRKLKRRKNFVNRRLKKFFRRFAPAEYQKNIKKRSLWNFGEAFFEFSCGNRVHNLGKEEGISWAFHYIAGKESIGGEETVFQDADKSEQCCHSYKPKMMLNVIVYPYKSNIYFCRETENLHKCDVYFSRLYETVLHKHRLLSQQCRARSR